MPDIQHPDYFVLATRQFGLEPGTYSTVDLAFAKANELRKLALYRGVEIEVHRVSTSTAAAPSNGSMTLLNFKTEYVGKYLPTHPEIEDGMSAEDVWRIIDDLIDTVAGYSGPLAGKLRDYVTNQYGD